eukprot:463045_1
MEGILVTISATILSLLLAALFSKLLVQSKSSKNAQTTQLSNNSPIHEILHNGYCVLESLIDENSCNKLREYLLTKYNKNKSDLSFNYFDGHYQIHLPNDYNNISKNILFNKTIHEILRSILGSSYYLSSYTCNANISKYNQPYHMDCSHFHPLEAIKIMGNCGPPHQIIVNIYLQDTNETNGSFDLIKNSHLVTDFSMDENGIINEKAIDKVKENSVRCNYPKGSVIFRDKRLWHRGTINHSEDVRFMASMTFTSRWLKLDTLPFMYDTQDLFNDDCPFSTWNIEYV